MLSTKKMLDKLGDVLPTYRFDRHNCSWFLTGGLCSAGLFHIYYFLKEREEKLNETDERKGLSSPGYCDDDRSWQPITSCADECWKHRGHYQRSDRGSGPLC